MTRTRSANKAIPISPRQGLRARPTKKSLTPRVQSYLDKHITKHRSLAKIPKSSSNNLYFYIFSQTNSEFGVFGITNDPHRRIGEYLKREHSTLNFSRRVKTQLWYGSRRSIFELETKLLAKIKRFHKYNHLLVTNPQNNQLEFFPSEYRDEIETMVNAMILEP